MSHFVLSKLLSTYLKVIISLLVFLGDNIFGTDANKI